MSESDKLPDSTLAQARDAIQSCGDERLNRLYRFERVAKIDKVGESFRNWRLLADSATEPNVFYSPLFFRAAVENLGTAISPEFLFVWKQGQQGTQKETLVGFFPFVNRKTVPFQKKWELWIHEYCYLGAPLIAGTEKAEDVLEAVRSYARQQGVTLIRFELFPAEGPLGRGLINLFRQHLVASFQVTAHLRAVTPYHLCASDPLAPSLSGHHLRELRRQKRKLEALGNLEFRVLQDPRFKELWLDWFLKLEDSGWKATLGTSIAQAEADTRFFRSLIMEGELQQMVRMEGLFLNGEPIAMKVFLNSPPASFAYKIAFDESLGKYSPGLQLEVESLQAFGGQTEIKWGDSCAVAGHLMAERVWHDRRALQTLVMSTGTLRGDLYVGVLPLLRILKRRVSKIRKQGLFSRKPKLPGKTPEKGAGKVPQKVPGRVADHQSGQVH